jgi:uncharacterized DUF497 family protein
MKGHEDSVSHIGTALDNNAGSIAVRQRSEVHAIARPNVYTVVYINVIMNLRAGGFDWDVGNRSKCEKHGVSISEIEARFLLGPRVAPDPNHSADEDRLIAVGKNRRGAIAICCFSRCAHMKAAA